MSKQDAMDDLLERIGGRDLFLWHRNSGAAVEASEYLIRYRRVLSNGLVDTKRIYLDTNYWIQLREAQRGRSSDAAYEFLRLMRTLVRSRRIICVNHHTSFFELAKQEGESLKVTANLVDELSEGVAISPTDELRYWEVGDYVASKLGLQYGGPSNYWTKIGQVIHSNLPELPGSTTPEGKRAIYKTLLDTLWNANLHDIFALFGWETKKSFGTDAIDGDTISKVEARKVYQLAKRWSLERTRRNEFAEVLRNNYRELFSKQVAKLNTEFGLEHNGVSVEKLSRGLLVAAYKDFDANSLGTFLPNAVIPTELYALYERDVSRKLNQNDWNDWQHAAVALPYCDFFFTERHLAHQLNNVLNMGTRYGCAIAGTLDESVQILASIS